MQTRQHHGNHVHLHKRVFIGLVHIFCHVCKLVVEPSNRGAGLRHLCPALLASVQTELLRHDCQHNGPAMEAL